MNIRLLSRFDRDVSSPDKVGITRGAKNSPDLLSGFVFLREIKSMSSFLYILKSDTNEIYYTGQSKNPTKRLLFHNSIEKGFTTRYRPWRIVFQQEFPDRKKQKLPKEK